MRVKNRKMHVHDSGFLRYFCVEMHLLSLSRHLFCAKAQCPGCHGALKMRQALQNSALCDNHLIIFASDSLYFTEYSIMKQQNNSQSRNYKPCDRLLVIEAYFSIFFFKFLSNLLAFNNYPCLRGKLGKRRDNWLRYRIFSSF